MTGLPGYRPGLDARRSHRAAIGLFHKYYLLANEACLRAIAAANAAAVTVPYPPLLRMAIDRAWRSRYKSQSVHKLQIRQLLRQLPEKSNEKT